VKIGLAEAALYLSTALV